MKIKRKYLEVLRLAVIGRTQPIELPWKIDGADGRTIRIKCGRRQINRASSVLDGLDACADDFPELEERPRALAEDASSIEIERRDKEAEAIDERNLALLDEEFTIVFSIKQLAFIQECFLVVESWRTGDPQMVLATMEAVGLPDDDALDLRQDGKGGVTWEVPKMKEDEEDDEEEDVELDGALREAPPAPAPVAAPGAVNVIAAPTPARRKKNGKAGNRKKSRKARQH